MSEILRFHSFFVGVTMLVVASVIVFIVVVLLIVGVIYIAASSGFDQNVRH